MEETPPQDDGIGEQGDGTGEDSSNYTGVTPDTVIGPLLPNDIKQCDSDMETQADAFSFEASTKTPGLTDATGASGDSHSDNQMLLHLKQAQVEIGKERTEQYAQNYHVSYEEARDRFYNSR